MLTLEIKNNFQQVIAENLIQDNLAQSIDNEHFGISGEHLYTLIQKERLTRFALPAMFNGFLAVKMQGLPHQSNCKFNVQFINEKGQPLLTAKQNDCLLTISPKQSVLLPEAMYQLLLLNNQLKEQYTEALCWKIIEVAKNSQAKIKFQGLPENNVITDVHYVGIDLVMNNDGSATVKPHIQNLSNESQAVAANKLLDDHAALLVISEIKGDYQIRYIAQQEVIRAYKKINQLKRIPKENLAKFQENPIAFILNGEESEDDYPALTLHSFRILGVGEPYVGYFGSKNLDSPIAAALFTDSSEAKESTRKKVERICENKSRNEIEEMAEQLHIAEKNNATNYEINGEIFYPQEYSTAKNLLNNIIKKISEPGKPRGGNGNNEKLVIKIDPNDEVSISFQTEHLKQLGDINSNNLEQASLFEEINFPPKSYQIAGVNWLVDLYQNKYKGGILADDMGLGKTYQVVTFLNFLFNHENFKQQEKRVLIVAPTVLLSNWRNECEKFLTEERINQLNISILRGEHLRHQKQEIRLENGSYNTFNVDEILKLNADIIITSYETLANYQFSFVDSQFNFGCIVFDEAHKIKNPNAKISQAARAISSQIDFSVLLTGTPIENELRDLWALFDVFAPEHFGAWKQFKDEFVNNEHNTDHRLREKCSNYLLRRLKKDYLGNELPDKKEQVHYVTLTQSEAESYYHYRNDSADTALGRLHKLKQFSLHQDLINEQSGEIHFAAFSKAQKLIELLEHIQQKNEKVIIFVINRAAQDLLRFSLEQHFHLDIGIINGDNNQNVEVVLDKFRSKKGFNIIILSTLAAGVGLTITEANHVIHYERWWNASKEDQASDRAYRIGQKKDVFIHHLIIKLSDNQITIDEAIHNLISQKRETAGFLIPPKSISSGEVFDGVGIQAGFSDKLKALSWQEFENKIAELYRKLDYDVSLTASEGRDFGADVIARKGVEIIAIQCKHSQKGNEQDQKAVYQLFTEAKSHYQATRLVAICNSHFNPMSHQLAKQHSIELIEEEQLINLLKKASVF